MKLEAEMRKGAVAALDKRIAYRRAEVARHTQEDFTSAGDRFLKRSPEATSNERILDSLLQARSDVLNLDLSPLVKPA